MKKAVILGERKGVVVEAPDPKPKEDFVVVKVHAAPMCAEYKWFAKGNKAEFIGHEAAGEVVEIAQPGRVKVGDRVVVMPQYPCGVCRLCVAGDYVHCQHNHNLMNYLGTREGSATMAQFLVKQSWLLPKIPEGVSYERASLACCGLGPSFGACERMNLGPFDTVLITGLGAVGLGAVVNARFRGARIIGVESHPWRCERARKMGVETVIDPREEKALDRIMDLTGGLGVDKAVDCSGVVPAHRLCIDAARRGGQVAFVGECNDETPLKISPDMIRKGLTLHGVWHYNLALFPKIMKVIQESPLLDDLISHVFPLSKVQEAWELQVSGNCAKVILKPWE